jgi:hypothetical protein
VSKVNKYALGRARVSAFPVIVLVGLGSIAGLIFDRTQSPAACYSAAAPCQSPTDLLWMRKLNKRTIPETRPGRRCRQDGLPFETFGNEGFWTDAMVLEKGMKGEKFTPVQALKADLQVDVEALDPAIREALEKELATDLAPRNALMLTDPKTMVKLVNANTSLA